MALSQFQGVKSLNKSPGRKRFIFKNFSQRVEEIDIDVFRSLDSMKSEPSDGSSFFRESLLYWRELNTAEDFISFYEEMMPWVQTLPQILLHKETIISKLLSRLRVEGRLSIEPILRLIAALSRDLLEEFLPFLQRISDSLVTLLKNGGEREPEILEQVFTSWSYLMMFLQKYLIRDVVHVLKITFPLRYYPKDFVQEFMAEAVSFLLRNAPVEQLIKGIRRIIFEVVKKGSPVRKSGVSSLLFHVMKGTSSRFHSRAEQVLRLLMDSSILSIGDKFSEGSEIVVEVVVGAFQRIYEELHPKELTLVWDCLFEDIFGCIRSGCFLHLSSLLSLLISAVRCSNVEKFCDYEPMHELIGLLIQTFILPSINTEAGVHSSDIVDRVLQLMLGLLDVPSISNDPSIISNISVQWAPVFELRNSSVLGFIKGLLQKDPSVPYSFRSLIVSAFSDITEASPVEVLNLMLTFFERLERNLQTSNGLYGVSEIKVSRICSFFQETICDWTRRVNEIEKDKERSSMKLCESELAVLWGILSCCHHVFGSKTNPSVVMNLVDALGRLVEIEADNITGLPMPVWQCLLGAALASYHKLLLANKTEVSETSKFLHLAKRYKSSAQVLFAVAEFLDSAFRDRSTGQEDAIHNFFHPELEVEKSVDAINVFAENLGFSDKVIRVSTLRILSHHEPLDHRSSSIDQQPLKKLKTEESKSCNEDSQYNNVIQLLLSIELTPLSISTSTKIINLISRLQRGLSAGKISEAYLPLLLNGVVGIFHNRFFHLWEPAVECLTILISKYFKIVWNSFVEYLERCQMEFLTCRDQLEEMNSERFSNSSVLGNRFKSFITPDSDSAPRTTVLSLLLQSIQKVPMVAESRSRQLVPMFLKFLGYLSDESFSVGSFICHSCKGKEWRIVLKEWLNLFKVMRNPRSLFRNQVLKEVLTERLLDETDPDIQLKVLDCLLNWKDDFLLPYNHHLRNLISTKSLREELIRWSLSMESHDIQEEHRESLIPLVIRMLLPKVRKLKTLASRKHASVQHRRAVLSFLAQLDINELPLFFSLLIKSLQPNAYGSEGVDHRFWSTCEKFSDKFQASNIAKSSVGNIIAKLSCKKQSGFLHVIEEVLLTFDELHIKPFLNLLMAFVVRILENCTLKLAGSKSIEPSLSGNISTEALTLHDSAIAVANPIITNAAIKQFKDLRSLCLKIISFVLNKYECHDLGTEFWDDFFISVKPLIDSFKQEGSSSEKPSSLFSCFVVMSRSPTLVSLLDREENLVPTIFSILTVKTASSAIISSVLSFIENLLNLDNDFDNHEDYAIKRVLLPHLAALILSLRGLFQCRKETQRKSITWPGKTELRIFKLLAKYIKEPSAALQFVDIILPFLTKKALSSDECLEGLHVIQRILPVLGRETTGKILNALYPLLISAGLDIRLAICDILDGLSINDPSLAILGKLVHELNAVSVLEMGEIDYDTRVNAYEAIKPKFLGALREDHALIILAHCVYDMSSEELILRQCASRSLLSFVHFAALILEWEANNCLEMPSRDEACEYVIHEAEGTFNFDVSWTKSSIQHTVQKVLLRHMGEAMGKENYVQKEWIILLREMVLILPRVAALNSFRSLCSQDAEVDFFNNILHLQKHRRARALSRFRNLIGAGDFSEDITKKIFVPLFFNMLFDVKDGKGEHVRNACVETLASISGHMQWPSYHSFLMKCFREMTLKPDKEKLLLRLICSILDMFHFSEACSSQEAKKSSYEVPNSTVLQKCSYTVPAPRCADSGVPLEIQVSLQQTVLPQIRKLLASDSEKVNVTISLAALKILKLLPVDTMESQLPSIIHRISNFLKNRLESIRDEARSALAACSKELGLEYLHFIVKVLRATLKRGYEMHVLGYTLNFILSKSLLHPSVGKLDYCLEELLLVAENDILGDVAEEKEVEKIASKMKETRKSKSFETLKLIAQSIIFKTHALKLLSPIKTRLQTHLKPKMKAKLETMLQHIAIGIECNPSVDQSDLFVFVYGLLEDGIAEEGLQSKNFSMTKTDEQSNNGILSKRNTLGELVACASQNSHLITVFALGLLHNRLNTMKLDKKDEQLLSMLDPFVELLANCLSSKYGDTISAALKCLAPLMRLPLPSLEAQADQMKQILLSIAQKSGNTSSPLMQSCLKLLTVLLRSTRIPLLNDQLHMLVQFPLFVDLESDPSFVGLSLLKAIVGRKLIVHEIYDVVTRVAELMVTSQLEPIRKKCGQILLQFLLDYQLSNKRLQQHLDFLLANLSYEHSTGREAVLEMIHAILIKFPKSVVDGQAQTFFLHLVVCLANDHDDKVCSMVGAAIKLLIGRTSQHHPILEYSLSWYTGENQQLWSSAAQVLGLLVEVLKKGFQRYINTILRVAKDIMASALDIVMNKEFNSSNDTTIPLWKEAYYTLVMLEKILFQFPELYLDKDFEEMWEAICKFLVHPHMSLRNISSRLVALYFAAASEAINVDPEKLNLGTFFLLKPSKLFLIASLFCCQLNTQLIDDAIGNIITQNLAFAVCGLHSFAKQRKFMDLHNFWSTLDPRENDNFRSAFELLDSRKGRKMLQCFTSMKDQNNQESVEDLQSLLVASLLKRMGKVALLKEDIQMKVVFNCFRMISSQIGSEGSRDYAVSMLLPLYKVCEGFSGRVITDEVKQLAEEVRDSIRGMLGMEKFVESYNLIRKNLKAKRDKRKHEEKLIAVIDPMRNAKRKLKIAAKHRSHKKRKIMTMKMGRWRS